jgi:hypothetical protein
MLQTPAAHAFCLPAFLNFSADQSFIVKKTKRKAKLAGLPTLLPKDKMQGQGKCPVFCFAYFDFTF